MKTQKPAPKRKQKPDTKTQLRELQKMVREVREGKVPAQQSDEHAKLFEKRSARLSQDLDDENKRLEQQRLEQQQ